MDSDFTSFIKRYQIIDKNLDLLTSKPDKLYQRLLNYELGGLELFRSKIVLKKTKKKHKKGNKKSRLTKPITNKTNDEKSPLNYINCSIKLC